MNDEIVSAVLEYFRKLRQNSQLRGESAAYIAGGVAVVWWSGFNRVTYDIDAVFSGAINILSRPEPVQIEGFEKPIELDATYTDVFSLIQDDYYNRAEEIADIDGLKIMIVAPVDLVIMKMSRFSSKDEADISSLISQNLVNREEFEILFNDAVSIFIGNPARFDYPLEFVNRQFDLLENSQKQRPL